jgi:hypothetical protein
MKKLILLCGALFLFESAFSKTSKHYDSLSRMTTSHLKQVCNTSTLKTKFTASQMGQNKALALQGPNKYLNQKIGLINYREQNRLNSISIGCTDNHIFETSKKDSIYQPKTFFGLGISGRHFMDFSSSSNDDVPKRYNISIIPEIGLNISNKIYVNYKLGFIRENWKYKNQYDYRWMTITTGIGLGYRMNINNNFNLFSELKPSFEYTYYKSLDISKSILRRQETPTYILALGIGVIYSPNKRISVLPQLEYAFRKSPETSLARSEVQFLELLPKVIFRYSFN